MYLKGNGFRINCKNSGGGFAVGRRERALRIMNKKVKEKENPPLKDDGGTKYNVGIFFKQTEPGRHHLDNLR